MLLLFWRSTPTPEPAVTPTGGWKNWRSIYKREQTKDEIRRERERLGIVPRQARKIERVADDLVDRIDAYEPNAIVAQITASQEFSALLDALAKRDAERREMIAQFAANLILTRILQDREQEEAAIVTLFMEM